MRRRLAPALAVAALAAVAAGCGARGVVSPLPSEVKGPLPKATPVAAGNAANGKSLYGSNGCGGCHTFKPAGSNGKV